LAALTLVDRLTVGSDLAGVAIDSVDGHVFVADSGANSLYQLSERPLSVLATIPVGVGPAAVALDAMSRRLFAANTGDGTVVSIDVGSIQTLDSVYVGTGAGGPVGFGSAFAIDNAHGNVWVAHGVRGEPSALPPSLALPHIAVVDEQNLQIVGELNAAGFGGRVSGLAVDAVHGVAYVASVSGGGGSRVLGVYDLGTQTIVGSWNLTSGAGAFSVATDPGSDIVATAIVPYGLTILSRLEASSAGTVPGTDEIVKMPNYAWVVAVDTTSNVIYVLCHDQPVSTDVAAGTDGGGNGALVAVDENTRAIIGSTPLSGRPRDIAVDPNTNLVFITDDAGVSVYSGISGTQQSP
jgi:YVTN family beta-propeller protein